MNCIYCNAELVKEGDEWFPTQVNTGGTRKNQVNIHNIIHYSCHNEHCDYYRNGFSFSESDKQCFDNLIQILGDSGLKHKRGGGYTFKQKSRFADLINYFKVKQLYGGGFQVDVDFNTIKDSL